MALDQFAMWLGYALMGAGVAIVVAFVFGYVAVYFWQKMMREVPSWLYVQNAVAMYREKYPPSRWAREQMGIEWPEGNGPKATKEQP